jgi:hypothetical protein
VRERFVYDDLGEDWWIVRLYNDCPYWPIYKTIPTDVAEWCYDNLPSYREYKDRYSISLSDKDVLHFRMRWG